MNPEPKKNKNPFVIWMLGPTSSGKTTIGKYFVEEMRRKGIPSIHFDGDEIRAFFGSSLGFKPEDRLRAVSVCAHLANKSAEAGLNVVVSALTANEDARNYVSDKIPGHTLVYLECPIEVCIERDSRGLYRKAQEGKIDPKTLIGLNAPYVRPESPDIVIDTSKNSPQEATEIIRQWFNRAGHSL